MSGAPALRLELHPSGRLAALVGAVHLAAGFCLWLAVGGAVGLALAALLPALGAAAAWNRALLRGRHAPHAIVLGTGGQARVELAGGGRCAAAAGRRSVGRYWVSFPLDAASPGVVLIAADMLGAQEFRLLRLWALWGQVPGVAYAQPAA